jgi:hypothetical protein
MKSPTELSLNYLRKQGYTVAVTEHWNPFGKVRVDLFGIIDLVAIKAGVPGILGIQTTSKSNISARVAKSKNNKDLLTWYKAGNNFKIHGWYKENGCWKVEERPVVKKCFLPELKLKNPF